MASRPLSPTARLMLAAMVISFVTGTLAAVLTSRTLDRYFFALLDRAEVANLTPRKPGGLEGTYQEAIEKVRPVSTRSMALFLPASVDSATPTAWVNNPQAPLGVVVSADGWVLTTPDALVGKNDIWIEHERYAPGAVVKDPLTGLVLVKAQDAQSLTAVGFGDGAAVGSGEIMLMVTGDGQLAPISVLDAAQRRGSISAPAEVFFTGWAFALTPKSHGLLFSPKGEFLGLLDSSGLATPIHHLEDFITEGIRDGVVRQAALGVYAADISRVYNIDPLLTAGRHEGALVVASGSGAPAVLRGGPAESAGLEAKDLIVALDGVPLTAQTTLAELLQSYEPEQTVRVTVLRGGETADLSLTLGDFADLVY